ncbi:MAG: DUF11 domain-containing protein [Gammaproteobacteria bacterium]|nr:DUF11 domain-containing protein [Gammaproteobacteria bacterium]
MLRLLCIFLAFTAMTLPSAALAVTVSVQVNSNTDDAEEDLPASDGSVSRGSSDLELAYEGSQPQLIGMRFRNIAVPAGVTILNAYIQFTVDETDSGSTNLNIFGEASDDAGGIGGGTHELSNRPRTAANTAWNNVPPWNTVGAAGPDQRTSNIANIIQEITDRPGWASGNDMLIMIEPGSGCTSSACQRTAESHNGSNANAPILVIEYVTVVPNTADLAITKTDAADPVANGDIVNYTITVTNNGPLDATGVTVTDVLPAGVGFISASASQGSCSENLGTVTCNIGAVSAGNNAMIYLVVTMPAVGGSITNTASVTGDQPDANPNNDTASETTSVRPLNSNQLCYLVADSGGGGGGDDLLTRIDTSDPDPATNETDIGSGTGTSAVEAIAWDAAAGVLYGANAGRLGTISTVSGVFTNRPQSFGTGSGSAGNITLDDIDGLAWDATSGLLYGSHSRGGNDLLLVIDPVSGAHIPNAFGPGVDYVEIQPVLGNDIVDDIAVDPTTGVMYAVLNSGGNSDRLIIIDKANGATTDIALLTVPDIEGLGTDAFGQLWGTSGTQNILYEIDKNTGTGFNPRALDNGSDYEAVDCYASSPSVVADIGVVKIVDDPAPAPADNIAYTITVSNAGTGNASILQISDVLPAGVTYTSSSTATGVYDPSSGVWFIGTLAAGASTILQINADVDTDVDGSTITNTASVLTLFQIDPNPANDSDSADINPAVPVISSFKQVTTLSDPFSTGGNPKALPGAIVEYRIEVSNAGTGLTDSGSLIVTDQIPANLALVVSDFDATNPGPVAFVDGSPASGLSYSFISLGDATDDIRFSNDGGVSFSYTPVDSGNGTDPAVTHFQVQLGGSFLAAAAGDRQFELRFKAEVQ